MLFWRVNFLVNYIILTSFSVIASRVISHTFGYFLGVLFSFFCGTLFPVLFWRVIILIALFPVLFRSVFCFYFVVFISCYYTMSYLSRAVSSVLFSVLFLVQFSCFKLSFSFFVKCAHLLENIIMPVGVLVLILVLCCRIEKFSKWNFISKPVELFN